METRKKIALLVVIGVIVLLVVFLWPLVTGKLSENGSAEPHADEATPIQHAGTGPMTPSAVEAVVPTNGSITSEVKAAASDSVESEDVLPAEFTGELDLTIHCIDALRQTPVERFTVMVTLEDGATHTFAAADGQCLAPHRFKQAHVRAAGYATATIKPTSRSEIRCFLDPLIGNGLVLMDGKPVQDCVVQLCRHFGERTDLEPTNAEGRFWFPVATDYPGFELCASTSSGGVGRCYCYPRQAGATIHIVPGASLRVFADEALPAIEVYTVRGLEGRHDGGADNAVISGLTPGGLALVRRADGPLLGRVDLGPPGSEVSLFVVTDLPEVWLLLHDRQGSPIKLSDGAKVRVIDLGTATEPRLRPSPPAVRLSLGDVSPSARNWQIEVRDGGGAVTWSGVLGSARRDGDAWSVRLAPVNTWSGVVLHQGKPVDGARVAVGNQVVEDAVLTGADGRFTVSARAATRLHAQWREFSAFIEAAPAKDLVLELVESRRLAVRVPPLRDFTVAWKGPMGPWCAPAVAVDGEAVLHTPGLPGTLQLRAGPLTIEERVDESTSVAALDFPNPTNIQVRVEQDGKPVAGIEVTSAQADRGGAGRITRVLMMTGSDGIARVTLPGDLKYLFTSSLGSGSVDPKLGTIAVIRSGDKSGAMVPVFGRLSWQPDLQELRLYQTSATIRGATTQRELRDSGQQFLQVMGVTPGALSYTARMLPELPCILLMTRDERLLPVGTLRETPGGWRCDLVLDEDLRD